jgi:tetratricopeptide (TPR) repeat protein
MRISQVMAPLVVLVVLAASPARADPLTDQAKRDVAAGLAAQSAGRYDEAIALYKKAFDAVPHPEIAFDLGQAYRLKGDADTALGYYRRYLAVAPNGRVARDARHWVAELGKQIAENKRKQGPTAVDANPWEPSASAPAIAPGPTARPGQGPPGAPASGTAISTAPAADRGAPVPAGTPQPAGAASARPATAVTGSATPAATPDPAASARRLTYTWIAAGAGAGAVIGGLVFGGLARSKLNEAIQICGSDRRCDSSEDLARASALHAQSRTRGTVSTVLVVVGVAGLGTSAALWWTGRRAEAPRTAVAPVVSPDGVGAAIAGVF